MTQSLAQAVRAATETLAQAGIDSARADAIALAAFALGTTRAEVQRLAVIGADAPVGLQDLVAERARRVPLQHLTGTAGFRRLELSVGPGVFVPRPETELTAGLAIAAVQSLVAAAGRVAEPVVVDLCAGSGAIALAVKDETPQARVHAVELSRLAHAWAMRNRDDLGLDVQILLDDATRALPELEGAVDVVVSNPPYIPVGAVPNDPEVRDHDPEVALFGGSEDGLAIPLAVAARAAALLVAGGVLVMEHADVQGQSLPAALRATGAWDHVQDHQDLNNRPRVVTAVRTA